MSNRSQMRRIVIAAMLLALAGFGPASASPLGACSNGVPVESWGWQGSWTERPVLHAAGETTFRGTIFAPAGLEQTEPARAVPAIALQHGYNATQCQIWWAARALAGQGYIALTFDAHPYGLDGPSFAATLRAAVEYLSSPANPLAPWIDRDRLGIGGHSQGALASAHIQEDPPDGVRAFVAMDSLQRYAGQTLGCGDQSRRSFVPRLPALGEASDVPCAGKDIREPDMKKEGFNWWTSQSRFVPAMAVAFRNSDHVSWAQQQVTPAYQEQMFRRFSYYMSAWFDLWVRGDLSARDRLLARTIDGEDLASVVSGRYRSAVSLGDLHCADLLAGCDAA